ncbi:MAG TPA: copper resistance protein B [Vicinamibacterales bacterium]
MQDRFSALMAASAILLAFAACPAHAQHAGHGTSSAQEHGGRAGGHEQHRHDRAGDAGSRQPFIPPVTDEDRAAAFPELKQRHAVHDNAVHSFVLVDQLEWFGVGDAEVGWNGQGWIGRDIDRFRFRTEGRAGDGSLASGEMNALYGRAVARWWELVAGVRHDFRPGPSRTWAAIGIQGLAPYWFDVQATAYVGGAGRTALRVEAETDLLLTNRLILQPRLEFDLYGRDDPERGIGAGLSSGEAGLRLRYEIRRELAPYVGIVWKRAFAGTAELARAAGEPTGNMRVVAGLRAWF